MPWSWALPGWIAGRHAADVAIARGDTPLGDDRLAQCAVLLAWETLNMGTGAQRQSYAAGYQRGYALRWFQATLGRETARCLGFR